MEPETAKTLKIGSTFFLFTEKDVFLVPESEYKPFQQKKEEYVSLKRKHLPDVTDRDVERIVCIVCHEETALEDFITPLCRRMCFVLCRECMDRLKKTKNKKEVVCPYCKEKKSDRVYQEEMIGIMFSLMSPQTLPRLELRPDMKVKTVTRLTRETRVALSDVCVSDALFFRLLARTVLEVTNTVSLFPHDNSLDCCAGEVDARTGRRTKVFIGSGYTSEEMKRVYSNIKTIPKNSIQINAKEIHAEGDGVYFLLKAWAGAGGCSPDLFLESTKGEHIEEFLKEENNSLWIGKVKRLDLRRYAVGILPKLGLCEENEIEKLSLDSNSPAELAEILKTENSSIWVGKVKKVELTGSAVGILPKLGLHGENETEVFSLHTKDYENITEILRAENSTIWIGKVKRLVVGKHAIEILPKLRIHEENKMDELCLDADNLGHITGILKTENTSIWVGKVKTLKLTGHAVETLPKLRIREGNVMEELVLRTDKIEHATEILRMENKSIWVGKMKNLELSGCAVRILPKLGIHEENVMEKLELDAEHSREITEILEMERKSLWIGKVKKLRLVGYAVATLSKLRIHGENEMKGFILNAYSPEHITEILKTENNSIWMGKVKRMELNGYAIETLPKLQICKENVMEELSFDTEDPNHLAGIHETENNSLWMGEVKNLNLGGYAVEILPKLRIHEENVMVELKLRTYGVEHIARILKEESNSIWMGRVRKLELFDHAVEILPKLRFHEENEMEKLVLHVCDPGVISEILEMENSSLWVGKVKKLRLTGSAIETLPKFRLSQENEMEELVLSTDHSCNTTGILEEENNSVWIGKVKRLELKAHAIQILPKLRLHEENVMEKLVLCADYPKHIAEILKEKKKGVWIGKAWKISLKAHAKKIKDKLDFTLMDDLQE
ncbi:MAG: uncharacterized protein A8A55_2641 [Amphiamblys sp. WSBS2006]|nr:MAG: uncharacterized protein A8A55_2641 [Amphiamblys sp. WSBS2006]